MWALQRATQEAENVYYLVVVCGGEVRFSSSS